MFNAPSGLQNNLPAWFSHDDSNTPLRIPTLPCLFWLCLLASGKAPQTEPAPKAEPGHRITAVIHDGSQLVLSLRVGKGRIRINEFGPQNAPGAKGEKVIDRDFSEDDSVQARGSQSLDLRIPSAGHSFNGFAVVDDKDQPVQPLQYVSQWWKGQKDPDHGLPPVEKGAVKGLQVQMIDDAIDLGVRHAALNLNLASLVRIPANPGDKTITIDGQTLGFRSEVLAGMQVDRMTEKNIRVYLIILAYRSGNPKIDSLLLHPAMAADAPNRLGAFNTATADGVKVYSWLLENIDDYFSARTSINNQKATPIAGWIIGNEVNAHHEWYNRGPATPEQVVGDYHRALRIAHSVLRSSGSPGRIYVSLEHHWTVLPNANPKQSLPGREFLERLLELCRKHGNFDWHLAYHPYPSNLFEPRSWLDKDALPTLETPKITFKNLEQLALWTELPKSRIDGKPRRIILSEQGFHSPPGVEGEKRQAAGFVFAWKKVRSLAQIDAFILHRHVDHAIEGGLNLGLWTNKAGQICTPDQKKAIWPVFQAAGTPAEALAFDPFRAVMGEKVWQSVEPKKP